MTNGPITVRGELDAVTKPILTFSANTDLFLVNASYFVLRDIELRNTNATKTLSYAVRVNTFTLIGTFISGITANHATDKWYRGIGIQGAGTKVTRCSIGNCVDSGVFVSSNGHGGWDIIENDVFSCGSHGFEISGQIFGINIVRNIIRGNTDDGINHTSYNDGRTKGLYSDNIIYNNGGSGIEIVSAALGLPSIINNIIANNGAYGIESAAGGNDDAMSQIIDRNAYYANTSGLTIGVSTETNAITLSASPFVDAAGGDFNLNNTAGGGATLRAETVVLP